MTGARQFAKQKERDRAAAVRQVEAEREVTASEASPPDGEPEVGDGAETKTEPKTSAPDWRLAVVWTRMPTGGSVTTSLGALRSRIVVGVDAERVSVDGSRVVIERMVGDKRQRVDLPLELCILEYQ